jgi:endonuclease/exonuclease/phosphatase family metal-dependent hydrolase
MRNIVPLLFGFAIFFQSCAPTKETSPPASTSEKKTFTSTVKVLSLNANHLLKEKGEIKKLADWAKSLGVEILAVQQIERPTETKPGFDAVQEFSKVADMYQYFGKARYLDGFDSGNALFSVYPIKQTAVMQLPVGKGKVRRSLSYGVIDVGLRSIGVASTELDDQSSSERQTQVEEIFSIEKSLSDFPFLLCGAFYEPLTGKIPLKMKERFTAANSLQEETSGMTQQVYVKNGTPLNTLSVEKVQYRKWDGLLVTLLVTQ